MRKLIIMALAIFAGVQLMAQTETDYIEIARDVLKTEKKAAISEVLNLTQQQADVFWPLYNEYNNKIAEIQNEKIKVILDFAENFDNMSDEKADELMTTVLKVDQQLLKLKKTYYKKFKKILPAGLAVKYFQAENKINAFINAELASEIPFVEIKALPF
jgi:DNA anti-recombination protein RmuC